MILTKSRVVALALFSLSLAQAAPVLVNGSLTGAVGANVVPSGWTILLGGPDTMDINNNGGTFGQTFVALPSGPSPDGGTWVGMIRDDNAPSGFNDRFGQLISGFDIGAVYTLSWYFGNFGVNVANTDHPGSIEVMIDGVTAGTGAQRATGSSWFLESFTFTATSTTHEIAFRPGSGERAYVSIDGISLAAAVPEPSTMLLLAGGLILGIAARRRFAK